MHRGETNASSFAYLSRPRMDFETSLLVYERNPAEMLIEKAALLT